MGAWDPVLCPLGGNSGHAVTAVEPKRHAHLSDVNLVNRPAKHTDTYIPGNCRLRLPGLGETSFHPRQVKLGLQPMNPFLAWPHPRPQNTVP